MNKARIEDENIQPAEASTELGFEDEQFDSPDWVPPFDLIVITLVFMAFLPDLIVWFFGLFGVNL